MLGSPLKRHLLGLGVGTDGLLTLTPPAPRIGLSDSQPGVRQIVRSFPGAPEAVAGRGRVMRAGLVLRTGARGGGMESVLGEGGAAVRTVTGTVGVGGSASARGMATGSTSIGGVNRTLTGLLAPDDESGRSAWTRRGDGPVEAEVARGGRMAAPTAEGGTAVA